MDLSQISTESLEKELELRKKNKYLEILENMPNEELKQTVINLRDIHMDIVAVLINYVVERMIETEQIKSADFNGIKSEDEMKLINTISSKLVEISTGTHRELHDQETRICLIHEMIETATKNKIKELKEK